MDDAGVVGSHVPDSLEELLEVHTPPKKAVRGYESTPVRVVLIRKPQLAFCGHFYALILD